jgi:hypothetical protein
MYFKDTNNISKPQFYKCACFYRGKDETRQQRKQLPAYAPLVLLKYCGRFKCQNLERRNLPRADKKTRPTFKHK